MKRAFIVYAMASVSLMAFAGCGSSNTAQTPAPAEQSVTAPPSAAANPGVPANMESQAQVAPKPLPVVPALTPDVAVATFLQSVRTGDDRTASALLTVAARTEMENADMVVQPPGSPSAQFQIGEVRVMPDQSGAHVLSTWSDETLAGDEKTYDITWILRKEGNDWRIAGMATRLFPDLDPLVLNFENPEEMRAKVQAADQELARRMQEGQPEGEIRQAELPQDPGTLPPR